MRILSLALAALAASALPSARACTRIVAATDNATAVSLSRTMDWSMSETNPDLIASPVGVKRTGDSGANSYDWVAKNGAICATFLGLSPSCVDGVNTAGLTASLLYLPQASMAMPGEGLTAPGAPPGVNITVWTQQVLDEYSSVSEVVEALERQPYVVSTFVLPGGAAAVGHMMVTDSTGASAVIEPVDGGRMRVFTKGPNGKPLKIMTNGPTFDVMLAKAEAWEAAGRPAAWTDASPDRYQRATYWLDRATIPADPVEATAVVRSLIRSAATPLHTDPAAGSPEVNPSRWTATVDLVRRLFILEPTESLAATVIPLDSLALDDPATPVRVLKTGTQQDKYAGVMKPSDWEVQADLMPGMLAKEPKTA